MTNISNSWDWIVGIRYVFLCIVVTETKYLFSQNGATAYSHNQLFHIAVSL